MTLWRLYSYDTLMEGLPQLFQHVAPKLWQFIQKENPVVRPRHVTRPRHLAAPDQPHLQDGLLWREGGGWWLGRCARLVAQVARYDPSDSLGPRRLARHQLDGGCRQLRAAAAGAAEFRHHRLGEAAHLLLDLRAAQARHLEVAQEQEVLGADQFLHPQQRRRHLVAAAHSTERALATGSQHWG